MKDPKTKRLSL